MKKLLLLTVLLSSTAFAQNATSGSPRVQGVPAGYGDPVQVTIRNTDGSAPGAMGSVTVTSSALPTGAATSAAQSTAATTLSTIATNTTSIATAANQSSELTLVGPVTETAPATDTASSGLNGRQQRIAQRLTTINTTLGTPFQAGGSIGNTTFAATQSGTWNIGTVTTLPALPANQSTNVAQINAVTPLMGNGVTGTGSLRVTLASDTTSNTNPLLVNQSQINGVTLAAGNGVVGTGVQRVTLASDGTGVVGLATGTNTIGALTANQSVNLAQTAGVTTVTGNGVTGTGSQRVTIASDNTAFNVLAVGGAAQGVTAVGNSLLMGVRFRTIASRASVSNGQVNELATDTVGTQLVTLFPPDSNTSVMDTNGLAVQPGLSATFWRYTSGASPILSNTTTAVTIIAAGGASVRNYIDACQITTTAFGAAVPLAIRDGAAGTVMFALVVPVAGFTQPAIINFSPPLRGTANTLAEIVTTTANTSGTVTANCQGHTGA